jgi:hypothetical protein
MKIMRYHAPNDPGIWVELKEEDGGWTAYQSHLSPNQDIKDPFDYARGIMNAGYIPDEVTEVIEILKDYEI